MPERRLLDPKLDIVFKRLFAEVPDLLLDLINAVRSTEPPIVELQVLNPEVTPEDIHGKSIVLDIFARDETGQVFNVEMQVRKHAGWSARSVFYLARLLSQQLQEGESYRQVRPVIGIHLIDFDLFAAHEQACWRFELRDHVYPDVVLDRSLQLNMIELPKADRLYHSRTTGSQTSPVLADWIAYFKHWHEESVMQQIQHPPIQKAYQHLHALSGDRKAWIQALVRERALHDAATEREEAEARIADAETRIADAEAKARRDLLRRQLQAKFGELPVLVEQQLQTAAPVQIERWAEQVLFAEHLQQIFSH